MVKIAEEHNDSQYSRNNNAKVANGGQNGGCPGNVQVAAGWSGVNEDGSDTPLCNEILSLFIEQPSLG